MNTMVLQAAGAAGQGAAGGSSLSFILMLRPQRKQQKELEAMRSALKKGDKVITAGGIYGVIADVDERTVLIKVDGETKLRVDKSSIQKDMSEAPAQSDKK